MIRIACVGDIMPGGVLHGKNADYVDKEVLLFLQSFDLRIGTLECAIGDIPTFDPEKMKRKKDIVYAPNSDLKRVKELGLDLVSLANNHIYDLGFEGLINTQEQLKKINIKFCGAGRNLSEASAPVVFNLKGKSIAFVAFCDWRDETVGYVPFATETSPGINPMFEDHMKKVIQTNREKYDYLFVILHWGVEHSYFPTLPVKKHAGLLQTWGVDGIIGGHTHRIQPVINRKDKVIFYSLGNFFFPDRYINSPRPTWYPESGTQTEDFPVTDGYPYVSEPTLKLWKKKARIGMIGEIIIDSSSLVSKFRQTIINSDNKLCFLKNRPSIGFYIATLCVKSQMYSSFYFIYRVTLSAKFRVLKFLCLS